MDTISWITYYANLWLAYATYWLTYLYKAYCDFPIEVRIAATIIMLCSFGIVCLILTTLGRMRHRARWAKTTRRLEERFGKAVEYLLSAECKPNMTRQEVIDLLGVDEELRNKKDVLRDNREKLLFCRMIYFKCISGNAAQGRHDNLHQLINLFSLREFLEKSTSIGNYRRKRDALSMLRTFKLYVSPWVVNQLRVSKNKYVQRLAMYASIMASSDSNLDYFETSFFDDNCCIYDEIELGFLLQRRRKSGAKLPNLASWALHQKNPNTQCVFVRLMRRFGQKEYCAQLEDLFRLSSHKKLKEEISRTWGYLNYRESENLLTDSILMQPDDTKVAIMHAVTRMGTGNSLKMLVDEYKDEINPHVRFEALRCLYNYGKEGLAQFQKLEVAKTENEHSFFSFFYNPATLATIKLDKEQAYRPSVETVYI